MKLYQPLLKAPEKVSELISLRQICMSKTVFIQLILSLLTEFNSLMSQRTVLSDYMSDYMSSKCPEMF